MADNQGKGHDHHGKSSKGLMDSKEVLEDIGLRIGDTFLDAGCGDGHLSLAASEMIGGEGRVYAVDADEEALSILRKEIAARDIVNIDVINSDISKKIPVFDESIDVAFMADVLHGLVIDGEMDGAMKEIARVTKHGGKLAIVEFKKAETPVGPPLDIRLSPDDTKEIVEKYGFGKVMEKEAGPYHYQVTFLRDERDIR